MDPLCRFKKMVNRHGFTLIELLIVVAIIAILAAIAVPNFMEAQVRAKVSRCKADMRSCATALETYRIDTNRYMLDYGWWIENGRSPVPGQNGYRIWQQLTTPIAYLTSPPTDGFQGSNDWSDPIPLYAYAGTDFIMYHVKRNLKQQSDFFGSYCFISPGPDKHYTVGLWCLLKDYADSYYDPSNGTVSAGEIVRIGP